MVWTHNDQWMVTCDQGGMVKYWQSNMNNVKIFTAHKEPVRQLRYDQYSCKWLTVHVFDFNESFSPSDIKLATCSDDATIRIWDFNEAREERMLTGTFHFSILSLSFHLAFEGHNWDVRCIDWHPTKGLLASGGKDNLLKLWDPKTEKELATL